MASRAIWTGAVSIGLVNVPCRLSTATTERTIRFHQLSSKTGARVKQKRVDSSTGEEVAYEDIAKGYEITPDRYVMIEPEELDVLAPKQAKTIELEKFVRASEIQPIFFASTYYIEPQPGAAKAYRLLTTAMEQTDRVGLGSIIIRTRQQLAVVWALDGVLRVSTMVWPDEINRLPEIEPADTADRELAMATQLIESLTEEFDPSEFHDTYREKVLDLIERKAAGEAIEAPPAAEEATSPTDVMAALEATLATAKEAKQAKSAKTKKEGVKT